MVDFQEANRPITYKKNAFDMFIRKKAVYPSVAFTRPGMLSSLIPLEST